MPDSAILAQVKSSGHKAAESMVEEKAGEDEEVLGRLDFSPRERGG